MKILLDENLPAKLKLDFGTVYEVKTVRDMSWLGKKERRIAGLVTFNGFGFFITVDKNLAKQQNISKFDIVIFLLLAKNNKHQILQPLIEKVKELLLTGTYEKFNQISF